MTTHYGRSTLKNKNIFVYYFRKTFLSQSSETCLNRSCSWFLPENAILQHVELFKKFIGHLCLYAYLDLTNFQFLTL